MLKELSKDTFEEDQSHDGQIPLPPVEFDAKAVEDSTRNTYNYMCRIRKSEEGQIPLPPVKFDAKAVEDSMRNAYNYMCRKK